PEQPPFDKWRKIDIICYQLSNDSKRDRNQNNDAEHMPGNGLTSCQHHRKSILHNSYHNSKKEKFKKYFYTLGTFFHAQSVAELKNLLWRTNSSTISCRSSVRTFQQA